jgi:hypothetical protein
MTTQIVSLEKNFDGLRRVADKIKTEKVVFLTNKEKLVHTLKMRDAIALEKKILTEVVIVENNKESICKALKNKQGIVNIVEDTPLSYWMISIAFILGMPVFHSNGMDMEQLPGPTAEFKNVLSELQMKLLHDLAEPKTHVELSAKNKMTPKELFPHLYGENGLIKLGLVSDANEKLELTEFGRLVLM